MDAIAWRRNPSQTIYPTPTSFRGKAIRGRHRVPPTEGKPPIHLDVTDVPSGRRAQTGRRGQARPIPPAAEKQAPKPRRGAGGSQRRNKKSFKPSSPRRRPHSSGTGTDSRYRNPQPDSLAPRRGHTRNSTTCAPPGHSPAGRSIEKDAPGNFAGALPLAPKYLTQSREPI